ncbi:unnamed protein product [Choristocarpus tenellus]
MDLPPTANRPPKGVGSILEEEFKVGKNYAGNLWRRVTNQLAEGHTLDLTTRKRSGPPSDFTPLKIAKIQEINAKNRIVTDHGETHSYEYECDATVDHVWYQK